MQKGPVRPASSALAILHPPTTSMKTADGKFPGGGGGGSL